MAPTPAQSEALTAGAPNLFMTGKIGMGVFYPWSFGAYSEIEAFEWDVAALPWPAWMGHDLERFNFMYPDQYFIMKGCLAPAEAWDLLKMLCSEEGQLEFPTKVGAMPARQAVAETAYVDVRMAETGLPKESIDVVTQGALHQTPSESHAFVHWQEMWEKGIQPPFEQVYLGELTPEQAVLEMEEAVNRVIEETTPT